MTKALWMAVPFCLAAATAAWTGSESGEVRDPSLSVGSIGYLGQVMDQFHETFDVYTDAWAVGNHFFQDRDGVWFEGTAQMALAFHQTGQREKAQALLGFLRSAQLHSGALPAASKDGLTTGFFLEDGQPWLYYRSAHVAATAWFALAEQGANPFWK